MSRKEGRIKCVCVLYHVWYILGTHDILLQYRRSVLFVLCWANTTSQREGLSDSRWSKVLTALHVGENGDTAAVKVWTSAPGYKDKKYSGF